MRIKVRDALGSELGRKGIRRKGVSRAGEPHGDQQRKNAHVLEIPIRAEVEGQAYLELLIPAYNLAANLGLHRERSLNATRHRTKKASAGQDPEQRGVLHSSS